MTPGAPPPGLCGRCRHARVVRSRRGSVFYLCRRAETDPRYPKYPSLPVVECPGFEDAGTEARGSAASP